MRREEEDEDVGRDEGVFVAVDNADETRSTGGDCLYDAFILGGKAGTVCQAREEVVN
jgi:hypothetical protein